MISYLHLFKSPSLFFFQLASHSLSFPLRLDRKFACILELVQYEGDKKFQAFADDLERALALFEKAHEWADLIKCLQKVAGTLQKYGIPLLIIFHV